MPHSHLSVKRCSLIAALPDVDEWSGIEARNLHGDDQGNLFWPVNQRRRYSLEPPRVAPAMRDLAALGVDSLPHLIRHLRDSRRTGLTYEASNTTISFGDVYDPRYTNPDQQPRGINLLTTSVPPPRRELKSYTYRVGDLSYVLVGKIVNRALNARAGSPGHILVCSPVENPALAAAVEKDWGGLSRPALRDSLVRDLRTFDSSQRHDALTRLCFYYPETGERKALEALSRPVNDANRAPFFADDLLMISTNAAARKSVKTFLAQHGQLYENTLVRQLSLYYIHPTSGTGKSEAERTRAGELLNGLYPKVNPYDPPSERTTTSWSMASTIDSLSAFPSRAVDRAVLRVFRELRDHRTSPEYSRYSERIAIAAIDRLKGKGKGCDEELAAYAEGRISVLGLETDPLSETHVVELNRLLGSMRGK